MKIRNYQNRRGLTLIFVVSMIVLFLLMGTTFVVVSNDYFKAARRRSQANIYTIDRTALVHQAFYELVRGPDLTNTQSPLRGQDLLSDMYGYGFRGDVGFAGNANIPRALDAMGNPISSGDQFIAIQLRSPGAATPDNMALNLRTNALDPLSDVPGRYNNHLLTFVSGSSAGISSRVIDYQVSGGVGTFIILASEWTRTGATSLSQFLSQLVGQSVVVNRIPFSGIGSGGFNSGQPEGAALLPPLALEPNRVGVPFVNLTSTGYLSDNAAAMESYDAPDFQNMFLSGFDDRTTPRRIIASFHRESLGPAANMAAVDAAGAVNPRSFSAFPSPTHTVDNDNSGENDSRWMDIGLPVSTNREGVRYKPLVAYRVVDMDGRVNLSTCGNLADVSYREEVGSSSGTLSLVPFAGQGYGPAEVSLSQLTSFGGPDTPASLAEYRQILESRYGTNGVPGVAGQDGWSLQKQFGYPGPNDTVGGLFATSPLDIRGRFAIDVPPTTGFPDLNFASFNNALPQTDFSVANAAFDTNVESPYESNFAPGQFQRWEDGDDDQPYTAIDLEKVLRPFDVDSSILSDRLTQIAPTIASTPSLRESITAESYEVPVSAYFGLRSNGRSENILQILRDRLTQEGVPDTDIELVVQTLLNPEVFAGLKMDINRPFGTGSDESGNSVIDEPGESDGAISLVGVADPVMLDLNNDHQPGGATGELAKAEFARHLYVLTLLVCEDEIDTTLLPRDEFRRAIAQWAINVVDFRDPDSINTPFEFDLTPFNGWNVDGVLEVSDPDLSNPDRAVVWGVERPELLITESFAHHDRRVEDRENDNGQNDDVDGGDDDFDSRLAPVSSAFIELYNPWTQNADNQIIPAELRDVSGVGVDLQRRTPGNHPVWRIGIRRQETDTTFLRSIYFADPNTATPAITDSGSVAFYSTRNLPPISPGHHAVVGSAGSSVTPGAPFTTWFGRLNAGSGAVEGTAASLMLDGTRSITLVPTMDPTDDQIIRNEWDGTAMVETTSKGVAVVIDQPRSLSISDPDAGYPAFDMAAGHVDVGDGYAFAETRDLPLDADPGMNASDLTAIWTNGITDRFRFACLQRLANPLLNWDEETNPYLTIDITPIDLLAFNGVRDNPDNDNSPALPERVAGIMDGDTDFSSLERGETSAGGMNALFARDDGEMANADEGATAGDGHNLSYEFVESFGRTNSSYTANAGTFFAWLTWNNRPYVSQYELANVPHSSSEELTRNFSTAASFNPYTEDHPSVGSAVQNVLGSQFGHLLNFHGFDDNAATGPRRANLYRLFDFTEVPSRYVGTEKWLNPDVFVNVPFNFVRNLKYPGKINLNTIPNEQVYDALMGDFAATLLPYSEFNNSRWRASGGSPSNPFFRPYRNSNEGNFVPAAVGVEENVDCGLFRRDPADPTRSLFDITSATRSGYARNAMRQRLGNLVTTRSSVFAIWITVGYFEVDETDTLRDISCGGVELGSDTGEVTRNRGFYIFDRSIPMAFEPGKNHNVERGILVQSIIE